jgi:hypothetical protein
MNTRSKTQTRKNNFNVVYGSTFVRGQQLTRLATANMPRIVFKPQKGRYYAVIIYDLHSPKQAYVHYMAVNDLNNIIVDYQPPSPPVKDKHYHVYVIDLYEQSGFLTISPVARHGFDPLGFAKAHGLRKIASRSFYVNPQGSG